MSETVLSSTIRSQDQNIKINEPVCSTINYFIEEGPWIRLTASFENDEKYQEKGKTISPTKGKKGYKTVYWLDGAGGEGMNAHMDEPFS